MFNWFKKKEKQSVVDNKPIQVINVSFYVDTESDVGIQVQWALENQQVASYLGRILFAICNGDFKNEIISLLRERIDESPESAEFIKLTAQSWADRELEKEKAKKESEDCDDPLVSPDSFFQQYTDKDGE